MGNLIDLTLKLFTEDSSFTRGLKNAGKQVQSFGKSIGSLAATWATIGGGFALAELGKEFAKTDIVANNLSAALGVLKSAVSVTVQGLLNLSQGSAALVDNFKEAAKGAREFAFAMDGLEDRVIANTNTIKQWEAEQERLITLGNDVTLPIKQRIKYLEEAQALEKKILKQRIADAKEAYDNELNLAASKFNIDKKLLDRYVQADAETAKKMESIDKNVARARNAMGDDYALRLENLYSRKWELEAESDKSTRRLVTKLSNLYAKEKNSIKEVVITLDEYIAKLKKAADQHYEFGTVSNPKFGQTGMGSMMPLAGISPDTIGGPFDYYVKAGEGSLNKLQSLKDAYAEIAEDFDREFTQVLIGSFQELVTVGFEALTSGVSNVGETLLSVLGGLLQQLGSMMIAAGVAFLQLQAAFLNPTNPASAIALIAAGAVLLGIGSAIKGLGSSGAGGTGSVSTTNMQSTTVHVVGTISGRDIKLANRRN